MYVSLTFPPGDDAVDRRTADASPIVGRLADILSGPLGTVAIQHLRVQPRQLRSVESVERILAAAAAMTLEHKRLEKISIEMISAGAGVTPQAAYRYFKDADELIRTALRCVVIREHERLILILADRVLLDSAEMAHAAVGLVLDACDRLYRYPSHLQADVLREYRQVGYDASLLMSGLICRPLNARDVRHSLDTIKVSVALTATIAVATSSTGKVSPLRGGQLEDMLATLFVGVLQSSESSFDAFREMGVDFEAFWTR